MIIVLDGIKRRRSIFDCRYHRTRILQRVIHRVGQRTVGTGLKILSAVHRRTNEAPVANRAEQRLRIGSHPAGCAVDAGNNVLHDSRFGPQKLAGLPVERINDSGFSGNTGHDLATLAGPDSRIDPADVGGAWRHSRVDEQALEWMIEIPMIHEVLVVPDHLAGVGIQRERRVVIEVRELISSKHELWGWRGYRCSDVEQIELGIVARHHPGSHVGPLLIRQAAPGLIAGFARHWNRARAP